MVLPEGLSPSTLIISLHMTQAKSLLLSMLWPWETDLSKWSSDQWPQFPLAGCLIVLAEAGIPRVCGGVLH